VKGERLVPTVMEQRASHPLFSLSPVVKNLNNSLPW